MSLKKYLNVYDFRTTLPGSGEEVNYKGLSTNTIKKLLVYENEDDPLKEEEILDSVLKISVIDEDFNVEDMYVWDRYYLFVKIREATKGSIYNFEYKCPKCSSQSIQNIDLSKLIINKPENPKNIIKIADDNIILTVGFPKRKKQKQLYNSINPTLSNTEKYVEMRLALLASYIQKVETPEGEENLSNEELTSFIGDLPEIELDKFKEWEEENKFGIELTADLTCRICSNTEKRELPMSNFFS